MELHAERCGSAPGVLLAGPGEVGTVFKRAVNIRMPSGMCLSVVDSCLDLAPNRIVLSEGIVDRLPIHPGDHVRVTGCKVYHSSFVIEFSPVQPIRQPIPPPSEQIARGISAALARGRGACLSYIGQTGGGALEQEIARLTQLLSGNQEAAWDLVGLGPGYTPAGDDVLVGYCALLSRLGWLDRSWHQDLVERVFVETTILSATALYFAGLGQVQEYLENVLISLDNPALLRNACGVLIEKVGSTSGSDMLLGVLAACRHYLQQGRAYKNAQASCN